MNLIFTNDFCLEHKYLKDKYVTKLENSIIKYNESLKQGIMYVDDATYTNCVELLGMLNSASPLLENKKSVKFIKALDSEVIEYLEEKTKDTQMLEFYLNPMGLNVKLVYDCGELISATTFGRSFREEDVLDIVKYILTDRNDNLSDFGLVTVWGSFVIPNENLDLVSEFCRVENPYQGVFSIIDYIKKRKEEQENYSSSEDFLEFGDILDFEDMNFEDILYYMATDVDLDDFPFESVEMKYQYLEDWGFITPEVQSIQKSSYLSMDIEEIGRIAEGNQQDFGYLTDGFRLLVLNDKDVILFKIGLWEITYFESIVKEIEWVDKKGKKLPVLKLEEEIALLKDNVNTDVLRVSEIVLNNVNLLLMLDIEIGKSVRFAYFGEMGILPITQNNEIILN